jgi:Zn finger protein HypA/HybF involved in hydrogenase expression
MKRKRKKEETVDAVCLRCDKVFQSVDPKINRICVPCKSANSKVYGLRIVSPRRLDGRQPTPENEA